MSKIAIDAPTEVPAKAWVKIRGIKYGFRELTIDEYNELLARATNIKRDQLTGAEEEDTDNAVMMRLMILKSCITNNIKIGDIGEKGYRLFRAFASVVNQLHFGEEPIVQLSGPDDDGDEKKASEPGNE